MTEVGRRIAQHISRERYSREMAKREGRALKAPRPRNTSLPAAPARWASALSSFFLLFGLQSQAEAACDFEQNSIWRKLKIGGTSAEIATTTGREVYCPELGNKDEDIQRRGGIKCFLRPQRLNMRSLIMFFDKRIENSIIDGQKTILTLKAATFHDCDQRVLGPPSFVGR